MNDHVTLRSGFLRAPGAPEILSIANCPEFVSTDATILDMMTSREEKHDRAGNSQMDTAVVSDLREQASSNQLPSLVVECGFRSALLSCAGWRHVALGTLSPGHQDSRIASVQKGSRRSSPLVEEFIGFYGTYQRLFSRLYCQLSRQDRRAEALMCNALSQVIGDFWEYWTASSLGGSILNGAQLADRCVRADQTEATPKRRWVAVNIAPPTSGRTRRDRGQAHAIAQFSSADDFSSPSLHVCLDPVTGLPVFAFCGRTRSFVTFSPGALKPNSARQLMQSVGGKDRE